MLKVIIADDEKKARTLIRNLGQWNELGLEILAEAEDGDELLELAERLQPDLILSDMRMPGLSGSQLIRTLSERFPSLKLIIVSGYDDFQYAKQAVASKAVDYLLKPIDLEQLDTALQKACDEIRNARKRLVETASLMIKANEADLIRRGRILNRIFYGNGVSPEEFQVCMPAVHDPSNASYSVMVLKASRYHWLNVRYGTDDQLLHFALTNIVNELADGRSMFAFNNERERNEILVLMTDPWDVTSLTAYVGEINEHVRQLLNIELYASVGTPYADWHCLPHSLGEARHAFMNLSFQQTKLHVYERSDQASFSSAQSSVLAFETEIGQSLETDDLTVVCLSIEKVLEETFGRPACRIGDVRDANQIVISSLRKLSAQADDGTAFLLELDRLEEKAALEYDLFTLETLYKQFIESVSSMFASRSRRKEKNAIYTIRNYIEHHYLSKLSLGELAAKFYLSEEHISRMFKDEFGINLFEYVTRLRIGKAKALLLSGEMTTNEIVELLGFVDASHFTKTFKKYTGMTPKAFRTHQYDTKTN